MLNASVGMQRVVQRLRLASMSRTDRHVLDRRHLRNGIGHRIGGSTIISVLIPTAGKRSDELVRLLRQLLTLTVAEWRHARARIERAVWTVDLRPARRPLRQAHWLSQAYRRRRFGRLDQLRDLQRSVRHSRLATNRRYRDAHPMAVGWEGSRRGFGLQTRMAVVGAALRHQVQAAIRTETALPVAVAGIVLFASVLSGGPGRTALPATGGPSGAGIEPRVAIGAGGASAAEGATGTFDAEGWPGPIAGGPVDRSAASLDEDVRRVLDELGPEARALTQEPVGEAAAVPTVDGPFLADGTLLKPIAVDTSVEDGSDLVRRYRVRQGDTLVGIARRYGVSMMTIWWANQLKSKNDLQIGQVLRIPTVNGLVVTVRDGDTLRSIARTHHVDPDTIYEANGLTDRTLVIGQTLLVPGALGDAIKTPKPQTPRSSGSGDGGSTPVRPPTTYDGGSFAWPVIGGGNYISQYFNYGHYGLDIAASYGSPVVAAASGTVIFAGYKSNGGGYQVWIAHGSGLYTTYNHMSGVSVGTGQHVSRGQQVGRIGCTGMCTGPHLHFEVWRGPVWSGGYRVNPLIYY